MSTVKQQYEQSKSGGMSRPVGHELVRV